MGSIKLAAAAAFLLLGAPVLAAEDEGDDMWIELTSSETGTVFYVRPKEVVSVDSFEPMRSIWFKADHSRDAQTKYRSSMREIFFNCREGTFNVGRGVGYLPNGSSETLPPDGPAYEKPIPETIMVTFVEGACINYKGQKISP